MCSSTPKAPVYVEPEEVEPPPVMVNPETTKKKKKTGKDDLRVSSGSKTSGLNIPT